MPIPIPSGATAVLVLEQFAHLDWDWLNPFPTNVDGTNEIQPYFGGNTQPANVIYTQAHDLLLQSDAYTYATCEMGFLQAFANSHPALLQAMVQSGRLQIIGGGITSPDSLLSNGECFLRNYVVGLQWMQTVSLPWTGCVWLPDDFGHDSQLPATLAAMGARAVGFARCPLASAYQGNMTSRQPAPQAGTILPLAPAQAGGCDFFWAAADGSQIFAHWMPLAYSQGTTLYGFNPASISSFLTPNQACSPTPYVHVPVSNDFSVPLGGGPPGTVVQNTLLDMIDAWSASNPQTPAVLSTFDQYVDSVLAYLAANPDTTFYTRSFHGDGNDADATTFRSNPYWMGFYASRMNIKSVHQQATRLLLAAETLDAILAFTGIALPDGPQNLLEAWAELVPSTHHDYITGTATDGVVAAEQMPRLASTMAMGTALLQQQMDTLVANLNPPASAALLVYNPLGIARTGLVEISSQAAQQIGTPLGQMQSAADGNVLVYVNAPSAGYTTFTDDYPDLPAEATITPQTGGASTYTLANGLVSASIAQSANWSLTDVTDLITKASILTLGNSFSFYADQGNIYEFGFECSGNRGFALYPPQAITPGQAAVTEAGPLRATVTSPVVVDFGFGVPQSYTLTYSLVAGESFLRMTLQGQAPSGTSMFVEFTFADAIVAIDHGTPNHWDFKTPATFGSCAFDSVVEPTHDFVLPYHEGGILGAIYHQAVPGWAISGNTLAGAVLRDTPSNGCDGRGAAGSDAVPHTITYALRIPSNMTDATTGLALQEARMYNTPMYAALITPSSGTAPLSLSLAAVDLPASALITAVKRGTFTPGDTIVRIYQPANEPEEIAVSVAGDATNAVACTALEQTPAAGSQPLVSGGKGGFSLTTQSAITTVRLPQFG